MRTGQHRATYINPKFSTFVSSSILQFSEFFETFWAEFGFFDVFENFGNNRWIFNGNALGSQDFRIYPRSIKEYGHNLVIFHHFTLWDDAFNGQFIGFQW